MKKPPYSQRDVNQIFKHIPARTLRQWALEGFYEWVGEEENGRGVHRQYSYLNLLQIGLAEELAKANYNTKVIKAVMQGFSLAHHKDQAKALEQFQLYFLITWPKDEKNKIEMGPITSQKLKEYMDTGSWRKFMVIDLNVINEKVDAWLKERLR